MITIVRVGALQSEHGERCVLWADHLVGRSPEAALQLSEDAVSWKHACVRWSHGSWELQDLGSLKGTFVNGVRILAGARVMLRVGARVRFGDMPCEWSVTDLDPPQALFTALDDGTLLTPRAGLIGLPSPENPEVSLYRRIDGVWVAESAERTWEPQRDEIIVAGGRSFRFQPDTRDSVPPASAQAERADGRGPDALLESGSSRPSRLPTSTLAVEFRVSHADQPEQRIEVVSVHGQERTQLALGTYTRLLLELARQRLRDQAASVPTLHNGWLDQQGLLRLLTIDAGQLVRDVYEAREQFADAGVVDAARIVERRNTSGSSQLRIGTDRITVLSL